MSDKTQDSDHDEASAPGGDRSREAPSESASDGATPDAGSGTEPRDGEDTDGKTAEDPFRSDSGSAFSVGPSGRDADTGTDPDGTSDASASASASAEERSPWAHSSSSEPRPLFEIPAAPRPKPRVEAAPAAAENSGLVDLREIAAGISSTSRPIDEDEALALDRLSGGFGSMAAAPLVDAPGSGSRSRGSGTKAPSLTPLYAIIAVLCAAVLVLGYLLLTVERAATPEEIAALVAAQLDEERAELKDELRDELAREADAKDSPEDAVAEGPPSDLDGIGADEAGTGSTDGGETGDDAPRIAALGHSRSSSGVGTRPRNRDPAGDPDPGGDAATPSGGGTGGEDAAADASGTTGAPPPPEPPKTSAVDCLLDPSAPGCAEKTAPKPKTSSEPAVDPNLPAKLTPAELRDGFHAVKDNAKACGPRYGASAGTKVRVKVSISGATGKVISARPENAENAALGKCVADALRKATFPKFGSKQLGSVYSVTM